jgi:hypothetical protein
MALTVFLKRRGGAVAPRRLLSHGSGCGGIADVIEARRVGKLRKAERGRAILQRLVYD